MRLRAPGRTIAGMSFAVISSAPIDVDHDGFVSTDALIGREDELRWLTAGLRTAQRGAGSLIVIEGGAGIGKSLFVREARRLARSMEMNVLARRGGAAALEAIVTEGPQPARQPVVQERGRISVDHGVDRVFAGRCAAGVGAVDSADVRVVVSGRRCSGCDDVQLDDRPAGQPAAPAGPQPEGAGAPQHGHAGPDA